MKRPITPAYTFTPGAGTLNLSGVTGFDVRNLFAVIDLKTGALIYAPLAGYGYSALSGTTLTLSASMTGLSGTDPLMIIYDDGGKPAEDESVQSVGTALGSDGTAPPALPGGATGVRGWLRYLGSLLSGTLAVSAAALPLPSGAAADGTDITGAAMPAGGSGIRGWLSALTKTIAGGAPNAPRAVVNGNLAASGDTVVLAVDGYNTAAVQIATGAWGGGPIVFEGSMDGGTNWTAVNMLLYAGSAPTSATIVGGLWEMACGGLSHVRIRASAALTGGPVGATLVATNGLKSIRVGNPSLNPLYTTPGKAASVGDTTIATGGTAQTLFGGVTPQNGWKVANPDPAEDLWVSDYLTAAPNGQGSYRIPAGGVITTEPLERPVGTVSVYGATTGHVVTARSW